MPPCRAFQSAPEINVTCAGLKVRAVELDTQTAKFDLLLSVEASEDGGYRATFEYARDLFDAPIQERQAALDQTIDAICGQFGSGAIRRGSLVDRDGDGRPNSP